MSKDTTVTPLSPEEALTRLVPLLTGSGAAVTSATTSTITGEVVTKKSASCLVTALLLLIMILPGVIYWIWAGKETHDPFSITIVPGPEGTTLTAAGKGKGAAAARHAIARV